MAWTALPLFLLAISNAGGDVVNGSFMRSLRCLGPHTVSSTCRVVDTSITNSERLRQLYSGQSSRVRDALDKGNLTLLSEADLVTLHPHLLYLIPVEAISEVGINNIGALVTKWSHLDPLVHHLFEAASLTNNQASFLLRLQGVNLSVAVEDALGRLISSWPRNFAVTGIGDPILAYLPAPYLYSLPLNEQSHQVHLLKVWMKTSAIRYWNDKSNVIKRAWAQLLLNNSHTFNLKNTSLNDLNKVGPFLVGFYCNELNLLNLDDPLKKREIFKYNFTSHQVRCLWNLTRTDSKLKEEIAVKYSHVMDKLLPEQVTDLPRELMKSNESTPYSLATARQLLKARMAGKNSQEEKLIAAGNLAYAIPNLKLYTYHTLSMESLIQLQSNNLSPAQAFYLTGKGSRVTANDNRLNQFISALPVSSVSKQLKLETIYFLLKRVNPQSPLVTVKLLSQLPTGLLGDWDSLKYILKNSAAKDILQLIPSQTIATILKELNATLHLASNMHLSLPDVMGDMLYSFSKSTLFLEYADCKNIEAMSDIDFPQYISLISKRLSPNGLNKDVQECWGRKFIEYIYLKASFVQQYLDQGLLNLMTSPDIEAAGGYILAMFDENDLIKMPKFDEVIYKLGRLSHSQLLTAAPKRKLISLIDAFLQKSEAEGEISYEQLYQLGNLTLLFTEDQISRIKDFKLALESQFLDRRICSVRSERQRWRKLLLSTLGPTKSWSGDDLMIAGDLMLVLSKDDFEAIPKEVIFDTIDQIVSSEYAEPMVNHYTRTFHHIPKFYQVCMATMNAEEQTSYKESLSNLMSFYIMGLRMQLNSVKEIPDAEEEIVLLKTHTVSPTESESNRQHHTPYISTPNLLQDNDDNPFIDFGFEEMETPFAPSIARSTHHAPKTVQKSSSTSGYTSLNKTVETQSTSSWKSKKSLSQGKTTAMQDQEMVESEKHPQHSYTVITDKVTVLPTQGQTKDFEMIHNSVLFTHGPRTPATEPPPISQKPNHTSEPDFTQPNFTEDVDPFDGFSFDEVVTPKDETPENFFKKKLFLDSELARASSTQNDRTVAPILIKHTASSHLRNPSTIHTTVPDTTKAAINIQTNKELPSTGSTEETDPFDDFSFGEVVTRKDVTPSYRKEGSKVEFEIVGDASSINEKKVLRNVMNRLFPSERITQKPDPEELASKEQTVGFQTNDRMPSTVSGGARLSESEPHTTIPSVPSSSWAPITTGLRTQESSENFSKLSIPNTVGIDINPESVGNKFYGSSVPDFSYTTSSPELFGRTSLKKATRSDSKVESALPEARPFTSAPLITEEQNEDMVLLKTKTVKPVKNPFVSSSLPRYLPTQPDPANVASDINEAMDVAISKLQNASIEQEDIEWEDMLFEPISDSSTRKSRHSDLDIQEGVLCGALRTVGIAAEVAVDENIIKSMTSVDLEDCADLLGKMDLPHSIKKHIWKEIPKEDLHLKGSLLSVLKHEDIDQINFDPEQPWALETVYALSEHNKDLRLAELVVNKMNLDIHALSAETLVSLGPFLCNVVLSGNYTNWAKGGHFLKASYLLGRRLHCDRPCLKEILLQAESVKMFGPSSNWTQYDVNSLGIIVAGMMEDEWTSLVSNCPDCLRGLTKEAALCLPETHLKIIPDDVMKNVPWTVRKVLEATGHPEGPAKPVDTLSLDRSVPTSASTMTYAIQCLTIILAVFVPLWSNQLFH